MSDRLAGTVTEFDEHAGLGTVATASPAPAAYPFHCTQIAGGSRTIAVGAVVTFSVHPGRLGRFEAADLQPAGD